MCVSPEFGVAASWESLGLPVRWGRQWEPGEVGPDLGRSEAQPFPSSDPPYFLSSPPSTLNALLHLSISLTFPIFSSPSLSPSIPCPSFSPPHNQPTAVLGPALRAGGTLLPGAAVPRGCPVPADGPWTALRLPPGAVGSRLPGLPGAASRGRQCQLRDLSLPPRGLLPPGAARALLPLRLRVRLGRAPL